MHTPITMPLFRLSCSPARIMAAASSGLSTRMGARQPLWGVKNAGNSSARYAATNTPCHHATRIAYTSLFLSNLYCNR